MYLAIFPCFVIGLFSLVELYGFFSDTKPSVQRTVLKCMEILADYQTQDIRRRDKIIGVGPVIKVATGFFYGATTNMKGGAEAILNIGCEHYFLICLGCGQSTNTRVE